MLNIDNQFEIGQEVYVIRKERTKEICPACNNQGHLVIDGNRFSCEKCNGRGYLRNTANIEYQVLGQYVVTLVKSITQLQDKKLLPKTVVTYNVGNEYMTLKEIPEHHLFVSCDEAITVCGDLNRKLNKGEWPNGK